MSIPRTPSQTVGPYLALGLPWTDGPDVVPEGSARAIVIRGQVLDGAGEPVPDALIETWQADPDGRFVGAPAVAEGRSGGFRGFGRCPTDEHGGYWIRTCKPGVVDASDGRPQAPHIDVSVFARGILTRLVTRVYFEDEVEANAIDPVLLSIAEPADRARLCATKTDDGYRFDIHLQGSAETPFFDV